MKKKSFYLPNPYGDALNIQFKYQVSFSSY